MSVRDDTIKILVEENIRLHEEVKSLRELLVDAARARDNLRETIKELKG